MTPDEAIQARTALARTKAEGEAYRQGVDDGYEAGRQDTGYSLVVGMALGASIVGLAWVAEAVFLAP
jgi:hypothetical protein